MSDEQIMQEWLVLLTNFPENFIHLGVWLLLTMLIMLPLERFLPHKQQKFLRKDFAADIGYYFLSGLLPAFFLVVSMGLIRFIGLQVIPSWWFTWIAELPFAVRVCGIIFFSEFGFYWAHRAAHMIPWLWEYHAIHHSPLEMDWLVSSRVHPLETVFTRSASYLLIFCMGLTQPLANGPDITLILLMTFNTFWNFFVHANVRIRLGWLEYLISSPAFHHWHHTNDSPSVINKNFSATLPWLDMLFGTYYSPKNAFPEHYGINKVLPKSFIKQLINPLWPIAD